MDVNRQNWQGRTIRRGSLTGVDFPLARGVLTLRSSRRTRSAVGRRLASALATVGVLLLPFGVAAGSFSTATAASSAEPAPVTLAAARQQTFTLPDVADAWTDSSDVEARHGADPILRVGVGVATHVAYLRFDTSTLPTTGRIVRASLLLTSAMATPAPATLTVNAIDGDPAWTEDGINYANAPDPNGGVTTGQYNDVVGAGQQVTVPLDDAPSHSWLRRTGAGSAQSLTVNNTAPDVDFTSRESAGGAPQLVVVIQPDPVIAFFGSGTCDPTQARYGNGLGTTTKPRQCKGKYVGDALFVDPADPSTLRVDVLAAVGDLQPSNGEYVKYCESSVLGVRGTPPNCPKGGFLSDRMLGRPSLLPILRATTGNHDYLAGDNGSNSVTDDSCAPATTYNNAHGYFDSIDDVDKTGPKRASDAWASDYMTSSGTGIPSGCNKDRDGSGGYYWYRVGQPADGTTGWGWTVISLNGNCITASALYANVTNTGCSVGSDQYKWLSAVLDHVNGTEGGGTGTPQCVAVMMHQQAWSNTTYQTKGLIKSTYAPFWNLMHDKGVDLVVNGNQHVYERFLPMGKPTATGKPLLESAAAPGGAGVIQITASTGGENHAKLTQNIDGVAGNDSPFYALTSPNRLRTPAGQQVSAAQDNSSFGTVNVTLHAGAFDSSFAAVNDGSGASFRDSVSSTCQNARTGS